MIPDDLLHYIKRLAIIPLACYLPARLLPLRKAYATANDVPIIVNLTRVSILIPVSYLCFRYTALKKDLIFACKLIPRLFAMLESPVRADLVDEVGVASVLAQNFSPRRKIHSHVRLIQNDYRFSDSC